MLPSKFQIGQGDDMQFGALRGAPEPAADTRDYAALLRATTEAVQWSNDQLDRATAYAQRQHDEMEALNAYAQEQADTIVALRAELREAKAPYGGVYRFAARARSELRPDGSVWHYDELGNFAKMVTPARPAPATEDKPKPDADGWIAWAGGECPVGREVEANVQVELRDGSRRCTRDEPWDWSNRGEDSDIVAYRVVR